MSLFSRSVCRRSASCAGALLLGLLLCSTEAPAANMEAYRILLNRHDLVPHPSPGDFTVCHSNGCDAHTRVHLSGSQWQQVRQLFLPPPASAVDERQTIARAISLLERIAGQLAGTAGDKGGNLRGFTSDSLQQDCVDESANTTTYLTLLAQEQLLHWHTVEPRATRGFVIFGWPHSTAVIRDKDSGKDWVVDSWFHDNGELPEVVPLALWRSGWHPDGFSSF